MEKILATLLRIQSLMNTKGSNNDIDCAIAEIRREIGNNSDQVLSLKITELVENFAKSSETVLQGLEEMKN